MIAGVGATVILITALTLLSVVSAMLLSGENVLGAFFICLLLFLGSLLLFVRVVSGKARTPSKGTIKTTGYILLILSCLMLVIPFFLAEAAAGSFYAVSVGLTGIVGSSMIIRRAAVPGNS